MEPVQSLPEPEYEGALTRKGSGFETADPGWRDELSQRLTRYRARRKAPPPRYPSLRLPFEGHDLFSRTPVQAESSSDVGFESISNHALALDGMQPETRTAEPPPALEQERTLNSSLPELPRTQARTGAKIIEFPSFAWGPPPPSPDELAEPVFERPRILEVPEVAPPPPALGGITIEPAQPEPIEKRLGIDIPLQSARVGLRIAASLIDWLIIAAASALFGFIFWKVAAVRPPRAEILGLAAGIPSLFWAGYQYLLIVYAGNTPGLSLCGLRLARFDGTSTTRALRRWRVLAAWLSAVSLGMGYIWLFLDEDVLCWHDRITHTYLAPKSQVSEKAP